MKRTKGFTLVELVIVIIIVGILSVVAVPIYKGYTRRAAASEGRALLGAVQSAQKVYYAEHGKFVSEASTSKGSILDVDARQNKYFKTFAVTSATSAGWTATTTGSDTANKITLKMTGLATGSPTLSEYGVTDY